MTTITLEALINKERQLVVALPDTMYVGRVKLTIEPLESVVSGDMALDLLENAGALDVDLGLPEDAQPILEPDFEDQ